MTARERLRALLDDTTGDQPAVPRRWLEELLAEPAPDADYTVSAVARLLSRAAPTVRAYCKAGRFPGAYQQGKDWRIPPAALEAFRTDATPPAPAAGLGGWRRHFKKGAA